MRLPNLLRINFNFIVIFDKFIILDKRTVCVEVDISFQVKVAHQKVFAGKVV